MRRLFLPTLATGLAAVATASPAVAVPPTTTVAVPPTTTVAAAPTPATGWQHGDTRDAKAKAVPASQPVRARRAHASSDPGTTIADFRFAPATITIHVGQTITWTNDGPSAHTATARDGSFSTGVLQKGQSASHTFTHSGTFAYICQIHTFMHGTVVVLAAAGSTPTTTPAHSSSGPGAGASHPQAQIAAAPAAAPTLPATGSNLVAVTASGLLLIALGVRLRGRRRTGEWR